MAGNAHSTRRNRIWLLLGSSPVLGWVVGGSGAPPLFIIGEVPNSRMPKEYGAPSPRTDPDGGRAGGLRPSSSHSPGWNGVSVVPWSCPPTDSNIMLYQSTTGPNQARPLSEKVSQRTSPGFRSMRREGAREREGALGSKRFACPTWHKTVIGETGKGIFCCNSSVAVKDFGPL